MKIRIFAICTCIMLTVLVICFAAGCTSSIPGQSAAGEPAAQKETAVPVTEAPIVKTEQPAGDDSAKDPRSAAPTAEPLKAGEPVLSDQEREVIIRQLRENRSPDPDTPLDGVPVYYETEMLDNLTCFEVLRFSRNKGMTDQPMGSSIGQIIFIYSSVSCRRADDNKYYLVYDLDTGFRLFIYSSDLYDHLGFSVLMKHGAELLCYDDFKGLKAGDTIDAVCAVDPVAECYKNHFDLYKAFAYPQKEFNDDHPGSIHYLSDGILEIDYEMTESGEIRIRNMIYNEDRILPDEDGRPLDYTICSVDLP